MNFTKTCQAFAMLCALGLLAGKAGATEPVQAIWHCSKTSAAEAPTSNPESSFGAGSEHGTIAVTLDDLLAVYSGYPVRLSGQPLFACFIPGQEDLSESALATLGLNASAMQMLSRRSAIVQRNLKLVTDEAEMLQCMHRHAPSFGYLSQATVTEKVAPCF